MANARSVRRWGDESLERRLRAQTPLGRSLLNATRYMDHWQIREFTKALRPDTVETLESLALGPGEDVFAEVLQWCSIDRSTQLLREIADFSDTIAAARVEAPRRLYAYVVGLRHSGYLSDARNDWPDPARKRSAEAMLRAALILPSQRLEWNHAARPEGVVIASWPLRHLIAARPDDVDRIIALLEERDLPAETDEDISAISYLLDGSVGPLDAGAL